MKTIIFLPLVVLLAQSQQALAQKLGDPELADVRAGFTTSTGLPVALGAVMKSYVDGRLVLESTMTLDTTAGPITTLPGGAITVAGTGGTTTFLHSLSNEGLTNTVINTANGRNIAQDTSLTVAIPHLDILQQQVALAGLATRLHDVLGTGLLGAASH